MTVEKKVPLAACPPVDIECIAEEILESAWGKKHEQLTLTSIKSVWAGLSDFILRNLLIGKNVAVPYLGVFLVCKAIDTGTGNKLSLVRPFFELLAGRFSSVPHHIGRHSPSARGAACQPSYVAISKASGVHRVLCAQVIKELATRLGVRIKSRSPLDIAFPGIGSLVTDKRNRVAFRFNQDLLEDIRAEQGGDDSARRKKSAREEHRPSSPLSGALFTLRRLCADADRTKSGCVQRLTLESWLFEHCRPALALVDAATVLDMLSLHTFGRSGRLVQYGTFLEAFEHAIQSARGLEGRPHAPVVRSLLPDTPEDPAPAPAARDHPPATPPPKESAQAHVHAQAHAHAQGHAQRDPPAAAGPKAARSPGPARHAVQILTIQEAPDGSRTEREETAAPPAGPAPAALPSAAEHVSVGKAVQQLPIQHPANLAASSDSMHAARASTADREAFAGRPEAIRPPRSGPRFAWMDEEAPVERSVPELRGGIDYFGLPVEKRTASRAACDDFNRQHFQRLYDARGWSSARMISSRSKDGISSTVTPKVGHDPLLMRAWEAARTSRDLSRPATAQALDEQVRAKKELQDTMRALEAAEARARVEADETAKAEEEAAKKEERARKMETLRMSWQEQLRARAAAREKLMAAEEQWPYCISHQPLDKLPLQGQPHYIGVPSRV